MQGLLKGNIPVQWLLDEKEAGKKFAQFVGVLNALPEGLKIADGLELFIAIQREGNAGGSEGSDNFGKGLESLEVAVGLAVHLDFENKGVESKSQSYRYKYIIRKRGWYIIDL